MWENSIGDLYYICTSTFCSDSNSIACLTGRDRAAEIRAGKYNLLKTTEQRYPICQFRIFEAGWFYKEI